MSMTPEDIEREEFYDKLTVDILREHRDYIVAEFVEDRMSSYFEEHSDILEAAENALSEARALADRSAAAALVFSMSSVEIAMRDVLLRPVVAGLVHNPDMSIAVADLVDIRDKKALTLLAFIFDEIGMPRLQDQRLPNGAFVWQEKTTLQELRNGVVHRGVSVTHEDAERGLVLAEYFLTNLYPQIRDHLTHRSTGWV